MSTTVEDATSVEDDDGVSLPDGGQSVGNHDGGTSAHTC